MKVIRENAVVAMPLTLPRLMIDRGDDMIVLMVRETGEELIGIILDMGNCSLDDCDRGVGGELQISSDNPRWVMYGGSVTLTN
jgi:hypothetical protein